MSKPLTDAEIAAQAAREVHAQCELWARTEHALGGEDQIQELAATILRAIEDSRQPDVALVRKTAFKEVEDFIALNGRNADIQSFVETKICE